MHALNTDELLNFCTAETERWREWFSLNPQTLDLPVDIAQASYVRDLVLHIVAVELRYAERLLGEKVTEYNELPTGTVEELFSTWRGSEEKLRKF